MSEPSPLVANTPIAITMGEPAGIGPELTARLYRDRSEHSVPPFIYLGSADQLRDTDPDIPVQVVGSPDEAASVFPAALPVLDIPLAVSCRPGQADPLNAGAVLDAIDQGIAMAKAGTVRALVTNPIQKASLKAAGFAFAGHTDYLAHLLAVDEAEAVMVLMGDAVRVACVTHHIPLNAVSAALSTDRILRTGRALAKGMQDRLGISAPRIAVSGLNPHAGEDSNIGEEDASIIAPAITALVAEGIDAFGPCPADSMFSPKLRAGYDIALCMYHDQALIAVKALCGMAVANVTLGLPIVRTSPGHGTALDIAGSGTADLAGLIAAVDVADKASSVADRASRQ